MGNVADVYVYAEQYTGTGGGNTVGPPDPNAPAASVLYLYMTALLGRSLTGSDTLADDELLDWIDWWNGLVSTLYPQGLGGADEGVFPVSDDFCIAMCEEFMGSEEMQTDYPCLVSDATLTSENVGALVTGIYQNAFNRTPGGTELSTWVDAVLDSSQPLLTLGFAILDDASGSDITTMNMRASAAGSWYDTVNTNINASLGEITWADVNAGTGSIPGFPTSAWDYISSVTSSTTQTEINDAASAFIANF
jgi:hypothetical protein